MRNAERRNRRSAEERLEAALQAALSRCLAARGGDVTTFEEAGLLTSDRGLVISLPESEFQLTIVRSR